MAFPAGAFFAADFLASAFLAGAFFAGACLAGAFFAGAFFAGAFFAGAFFDGGLLDGSLLDGSLLHGRLLHRGLLDGRLLCRGLRRRLLRRSCGRHTRFGSRLVRSRLLGGRLLRRRRARWAPLRRGRRLRGVLLGLLFTGRCDGSLRHVGHRAIDAAPQRGEAHHDDGHRLAELHHLASTRRRGVGHQSQRHVAAHAVLADRDVGTVRRVRLDGSVHARADRVVLDELEERHQVVDGFAGLGNTGPLCRRCRRGRLDIRRRRCRRLARPPGRRRLRHRHRLAGSVAGLATAPTFGLDVVLPRAATRPALRSGRLAADGAPHRHPIDEHPADVRHRLAADQAALVEQPLVVGVELLEGIVREDRRIRLLGDGEHEGIASTDCTGGRGDEFVVGDALLELLHLLLVDPVTERGVDDHGDGRVRMLLHETHHRLAELSEAGQRTALRGDVGPVDHDVAWPFS